jgi:IclR family transcriptional regulator, acetate operon repressor
MSSDNKPYPGTQSILRAVAILKSFDDEHTHWSLSQLSRKLELNKTTVFRMLSALESEGLVARSDLRESYILGPEIVTLAGFALRSHDLRSTARLTLEELAQTTGETTSLEIVSGDNMLVIDEVLGEHLVSGMRSLGTRWPLHSSSTGLAILAAWPDHKRDAYLQRKLLPTTSHTVTEAAELRKLLDRFQKQGFAVSDEMLEPGLVAIGAHLNNFDGQIGAAISIYGPKTRLNDKCIRSLGSLVQSAAANISAKMGHAP